jgi:hypothetical protein
LIIIALVGSDITPVSLFLTLTRQLPALQ